MSKEENKDSNKDSKLKKHRCRSASSQDYIDYDDPSLNGSNLPLVIGLCAMKKKVQSTPMKEILKHFSPDEFIIKDFDENMILNQKPSEWPIVDVLLSFYSFGFPLAKAQEYCELRKPMLINDLKKQELLWDRSLVYKELKKAGIPTPNHYFVYRDKTEDLYAKYKYNITPAEVDKNGDEIEEKKEENKKEISLRNFLNQASEEFKHNGGILIEKSNVGDEKKETKDLDFETKRKSNLAISLDDSCLQRKIKLEKLAEMPEDEKRQIIKNMLESTQKTRTLSFSLINEEIVFSPVLNKPKRKNSEEFIIEEADDHIIINDVKINKPFVEKPFDAENHDINIYYPLNDGGGCKRLFRKVGNISSKFDANCNEIRRNGNYIYEEFLPTDGFDIKVYTVGPDYAHAEARKSPVLDGKVQRNVTGKEVRYPVTLTPEEKIIARKISLWFGQNVCGFDLLRSNGNSYVCDVNGWSFVKGNTNYYRDCALMLRYMILLKLAPTKLESLTLRNYKISSVEKNSDVGQDSGQEEDNKISSIFRPVNEKIVPSREELRSIVAVFRHGDRTPKQKMKMKIRDERLLEFFKNELDKTKEIVIKKAIFLQKILDIARSIISELNKEVCFDSDEDHDNNMSKLFQLVSVLEKGGHFEEINRKIQMKPLKSMFIIDDNNVCTQKVTEALFIVKWGGELTHSGEFQAEHIGQMFRTYLYPNENEGILRLHSTYRHDLKIYSSDEGRCLKTAGAFTKGFLNLDGELTPIIVSMVRKDDVAQELLDMRSHKLDLSDIMKILSGSLNHSGKLIDTLKDHIDINNLTKNEREIIAYVNEPLEVMKKLHKNIKELTKIIRSHLNLKNKTYYINPLDMKLSNDITTSEDEEGNKTYNDKNKGLFIACGQENLILVFKRWRKLEIDFYDRRKENFNISKIPDIFDSIRYDMIHNYQYFGTMPDQIGFKIYESVEILARFLTPFEYGMSKKRKFDIGMTIIEPLFKKIKSDLLWWNTPVAQSKENYREESDYWMIRDVNKQEELGENQTIKSKWRHVRTRLYFTSASHLYSLFNVIKFGADSAFIHNAEEINKIDFLNYLSHIVFRLFENLTLDSNDPKRFRLELHVSPGNTAKMREQYKRHNVPISPLIMVNKNLSLNQLEELFKIMK